MSSEVLKRAIEINDYIVDIKRTIHKHPELSMEEYGTTAYIKSKLVEMGVEIIPLNIDLGVVGIIKGKKKGENLVTALRADIDALPIQEMSGIVDQSIVPGVMHACGHDSHTAMLLGAAKILMSIRDRFSGTVKLIFQPAEESFEGADYLIKNGVLDNPKVDFIFAIHGDNRYEMGEIALRKGVSMASSDLFTVKIMGESGHGAYPHNVASDTILAASNSIMAIQSIVTRQIDALENIVISICEIHGGTAKNIIPDTVEFSGTVRCHNEEVRNSIKERILEIINNVSSVYKCRAELDYNYGVPVLENSPILYDLVEKSARKIVGDGLRHIENPVMGSEDFSKYLEIVPEGLFARLGISTPNEKPIFHNSYFIFPEEALVYGTALFTQVVLDINNNIY